MDKRKQKDAGRKLSVVKTGITRKELEETPPGKTFVFLNDGRRVLVSNQTAELLAAVKASKEEDTLKLPMSAKRKLAKARKSARLASSDCKKVALVAEVSARRTAQVSRFAWKMFTLSVVAVGVLQMTSSAVFPTMLAKADVEPELREDGMTLSTALKEIPKEYDVNPIRIRAIAMQESTNGTNLHRFERHKLAIALKKTSDEYEARQLASSHCPMHVLGLTALDLGVEWRELYSTETCVRTGVRYFRECLDTFGNEDLATICYNTGPAGVNSAAGREYLAYVKSHERKLMARNAGLKVMR